VIGNVIGTPIVPAIQIAGNPCTVRARGEPIAVSGMLSRATTIPKAGHALIDRVVRTANSRLAVAESLGHRAFVMTTLYCSA